MSVEHPAPSRLIMQEDGHWLRARAREGKQGASGAIATTTVGYFGMVDGSDVSICSSVRFLMNLFGRVAMRPQFGRSRAS